MPEFQKIQQEIAGVSPPDDVRRAYIKKLHQKTGRPTAVYASAYTVKDVPAAGASIGAQDVQFFMAALHELKGDELDLVIHSPGGTSEATEQIVNYLRSKFTNLRVIVPQSAMSAATMLACAANRIVMGKHSAIGPIDPQVQTPNGVFPAQSILDEYDFAKQEIPSSPHTAALWAKKIMQFPPGLLIVCKNQVDRAQKLVGEWLAKYMFAGEQDATAKAESIAQWLGAHSEHLTHGHPIGIKLAREKGLVVDCLEDDQDLQDLVLSVFHATVATFLMTPCIKIVENHMGNGSLVLHQPKGPS